MANKEYRCSNKDCVWRNKPMDESVKVCPMCGFKVTRYTPPKEES